MDLFVFFGVERKRQIHVCIVGVVYCLEHRKGNKFVWVQ